MVKQLTRNVNGIVTIIKRVGKRKIMISSLHILCKLYVQYSMYNISKYSWHIILIFKDVNICYLPSFFLSMFSRNTPNKCTRILFMKWKLCWCTNQKIDYTDVLFVSVALPYNNFSEIEIK